MVENKYKNREELLVELLFQFAHSLGCYVLYLGEVLHAEVHWLRVYEVYFAAGFGVVDQSGGGVDVEGCSYYYKYVCFFYLFGCAAEFRDAFAKPYDERAELAAIGGFVSEVDIVVADIVSGEFVFDAAGFGEFAVKVDDFCAAGPFVEVVHVLGHYSYVKIVLQLRDDFVGVIRPGILQSSPSGIIKIEDKFLVPVPAVN